MKKQLKLPYSETDIRIILFSEQDVITTSGGFEIGTERDDEMFDEWGEYIGG